MRKLTLIANRDNRCLDDAELAGITGGKLLVSGIDCLEEEITPWTELNPAGDPGSAGTAHASQAAVGRQR